MQINRYTIYMSPRTYAALFGLLLVLMLPRAAFAASLYLDPDSGTFGPGDTFISTVRIDNQGECLNAVNVVLTYPTNTMRAVDFSRGNSIFSLWAVEPAIDTTAGTITFAGGIPGGYCGRIAGDASLSNVLGQVVFTVIAASSPSATISFGSASAAFLNDGQGTAATLDHHGATIALSASPVAPGVNPWLTEVGADTNPPQPFAVDIESAQGVFGGKYFLVFSTSDKESGLDHYDISEHGGWKRVTSPYLPADQSLFGVGDVQLRAVDKAGNIRMGTVSTTTAPRQLAAGDWIPLIIFALIILLVWLAVRYDHKLPRIGPA